MRDNNWLEEKMYDLWEEYFADVPRKNLVIIKFGRNAKRQLGCITWATNKTRGIQKYLKANDYQDHKKVSVIRITSKFKDEKIPEKVVLGTIAHEMCHYAHGFNSPLKQIYNHPHKGGVIKKEMEKRELGDIYHFSKKWIKANWEKHIR
ncbi:hypothetical protein GF389_04845 [Candidatus Dojkabacteria bacterium]|nr:hypothetical protein [Candidatus Dojkabacteria bacterium]